MPSSDGALVQSLIDREPDDGLFVEAAPLFSISIKSVRDMESVADLMLKGGPVIMASAGGSEPAGDDPRPPRSYWDALKKEFRVLVCTDEPRYADLRAKIMSSSTQSNTVVLAVIVAAMADHLGVTAGAITGLAAVLLSSLIQLGRGAFCHEELQ